ncbi:hypothetical protein BDV95DRAFT_132446 [Massariosphaeria phaeospora]|uniref:Uncharacterized protein n=1 Tax=Massariosphaeria phaeospora TaxID=100035 RepID=A0A7C8II04_9PLEO|nr:hypothetical protein BDV95DRAFT_132446 [Massariosphaeria phaeospora]
MSDDWFQHQLTPYGDGNVEDGCHPEEAQALKDYLRQDTPASEAAWAITHPIVTSDDPGDDLPRLWGFLQDALVQLPTENIEPLLALLQAIENLPEPNFAGLDRRNRPGDRLWKGLGSFGHMWADHYMNGTWRDHVSTVGGAERVALREEHVRKAHVEARMVKGGIGGIPIDWGYETVVDVLEWTNLLLPTVLDFEVPAAAEWLVICGQRFRQGAEKGEDSYAFKPHITTRDEVAYRHVWGVESDQVMSWERMSLWEERLRGLQTEPGVVQEAATKALGAMRQGDAPS